MNGQFAWSAKCAQHNVKSHPCERQPSRPVAAAEDECSRHDRHNFGDFNRNAVRLSQITNMEDSANDPHGEKKAGDNKNWNRTPDRVHRSTSTVLYHDGRVTIIFDT